MDLQHEIGLRIRYLRSQLNMTQEELAKKAGYTSRSSINKIEKGLVDLPRSKIVEIADALNTTASYLMGWDEEEKTSPEELTLTEGEKMLLELFRQIPADQQKVFLEMGRVYANSLKKE